MAESPKCGTAFSSPERQQRSRAAEILSEIASDADVRGIQRAFGASVSLHLVGGTVRDAVLGKKGSDIDLAAPLSAQEMLSRLEKSGFRVIPTGLKHGTITCAASGRNIEISSFRAGRGTHASTIEEDLSGRDFTINAMAFSVGEKKLLDPFGGIKDLDAGFLTFVGKPHDRIAEDPMRILRMVRFGHAAGRSVSGESAAAAAASGALLEGVSVERIRSELEKILLAPHPHAGVAALRDLSLLRFTLPELLPAVGFEQNDFHTEDVFDHTLTVLSKTPADRILRLAALYHDIGKAHTLSVDAQGRRHFYDHEKVSAEISTRSMTRLRFSNDDVESVSTLVRLHMRPFDCGPAGVRRILRDTGGLYAKWRELKNADRPVVFDDAVLEDLKTRFDSMVETERNRGKGSVFGKLAVNGDDLIKLGMKPGRELGGLLKDLEAAVIENPDMNERDALIDMARRRLKLS